MVAPRTTWKLLERYIQEGRGFGHGELYRAFIQLRRWNASPVSFQTYGGVPPFKRGTNFLCRSEWLLALLFAWCGGHIREQLPLWPWRHPEPIAGLDPARDQTLKWSSGTIDLCSKAAIKHGTFVGTSIPYIWTLDLAVTWAWLPLAERSCSLISVKPLESEQYGGDIDPLARGPEKLEVERRYAAELDLPYFVADRSTYPGPLLGQLELFASAAAAPEDENSTRALRWIKEGGETTLQVEPPLEWRSRFVKDFGLTIECADYLLHHINWHQHVDVDLTQEVFNDRCIQRGGRALVLGLRADLQRLEQ